MTLGPHLGPQTFTFDEQVLTLLDLGGGRRKWDVKAVPGQPGDGTQSKPAPIAMHSGFGATRRTRKVDGSPTDPGKHHFAQNVSAQFEGLVYPSPRVTYLDMGGSPESGAPGATRRRGFRVGGYSNSRVGGGGQGYDDLVTQSDFERGTAASWSTGGFNVRVLSTEQAHGGTTSLKVTYFNSTTLAQTAITCRYQHEHRARLWLYIPADWNGGELRASVSGFTGITVPDVAADMTLTAQWQRLTFAPFTPDADDLTGTIALSAASAPTAGRAVYVDDAQAGDSTSDSVGGGAGTLGGGAYGDTPQAIRDFGPMLYMHCGRYTFTVDPDRLVPALVDTHDHGVGARARSSDRFGGSLGVALGSTVHAQWLLGSAAVAVGAGETVETFAATGAQQTWYWPAGVTSAVFDVQGAQGMPATAGIGGGRGGRVRITVNKGTETFLTLVPGSQTGYPNGGTSPDGLHGGGGSSDVRRGGTTTADRIITAGGGGGTPTGGGFGVATGGKGGNLLGGTNGGTAIGGGPGGQGASIYAAGYGQGDGTNGVADQGGNGGVGGAQAIDDGAGAGGGYFGGGGGGSAPAGYVPGGGGGGSSYTALLGAEYDDGYRDGDGVITVAYTVGGAAASAWTDADLPFDVYKVGTAGRLFASTVNTIYHVEPGADPLVAASYLPSNGDVITDESDPVRSLVEYLDALAAGTARTVRTLDPDRGYEGVSLTPDTRMSASAYDGRAMLAVGHLLFHATARAITMFQAGRPPVKVGPELLTANESPYRGIEWGVPDYIGDWMVWPAYMPDSGDSVVFFANIEFSGDAGFGRFVQDVVWQDVLYLPGRECRAVRYWGGSGTRKPRLFLGAGTPANPFQAGWVDLGRGGGPDPFTTDGQPAEEGFIESPLDDLGSPGVNKSLERVEVPYLSGADGVNTLALSACTEDEVLVPLVVAQDGAAVASAEGFVAFYPPTDTPLFGRALRTRWTFTQAPGATADDWLLVRGTPMLYYSEVPSSVLVIDTVLDALTRDWEEAQVKADALLARWAQGHKALRDTPDGAGERWARLVAVQVSEHEVDGPAKGSDRRLGLTVQFRTVDVG